MTEDIPDPPKPGICRGCDAAITWTRTVTGRWSPLNLDGSPHWATCPFADKFRRRMKKGGTKTIGEVLFANRLDADAEPQRELSEPVE